ncbi:hypothetical protein B0D71_02615 [Pseudomonas laurylsulfativorans]|uniref:Uncharacterized protein n=1 Tax=Pseudomonas laurylsulfativorans TaxID=1943631 RepID=A0A2S3VVS1_9PSED|nr:hypothetical protein B0D71_02615 [Pseudomonas laurylsulfativorans]
MVHFPDRTIENRHKYLKASGLRDAHQHLLQLLKSFMTPDQNQGTTCETSVLDNDAPQSESGQKIRAFRLV